MINVEIRKHTPALELARLDELQETFYARAHAPPPCHNAWQKLKMRLGNAAGDFDLSALFR
jgi:hypothetical protein